MKNDPAGCGIISSTQHKGLVILHVVERRDHQTRKQIRFSWSSASSILVGKTQQQREWEDLFNILGTLYIPRVTLGSFLLCVMCYVKASQVMRSISLCSSLFSKSALFFLLLLSPSPFLLSFVLSFFDTCSWHARE